MHTLCCQALHLSQRIHGSLLSPSCSVAPQTHRMTSSSGSSCFSSAFLGFLPRFFGPGRLLLELEGFVLPLWCCAPIDEAPIL